MWLLFVTVIDIGVLNDSITSQQLEFGSYQSCMNGAEQIKMEHKKPLRKIRTSCVKK